MNSNNAPPQLALSQAPNWFVLVAAIVLVEEKEEEEEEWIARLFHIEALRTKAGA
jgi:hypothetical protein